MNARSVSVAATAAALGAALFGSLGGWLFAVIGGTLGFLIGLFGSLRDD